MARDTATVNQTPLGPSAIIGRTPSGRPILSNPDGSYSTELVVTFPHPFKKGAWANFPSLFGGKRLSEDEARQLFIQHKGLDPETGADFSRAFSSSDAAVKAAQAGSKQGGAFGRHP